MRDLHDGVTTSVLKSEKEIEIYVFSMKSIHLPRTLINVTQRSDVKKEGKAPKENSVKSMSPKDGLREGRCNAFYMDVMCFI